MPSSDRQRGRPFRDHRQVIEGIIYRLRTGIAWGGTCRSPSGTGRRCGSVTSASLPTAPGTRFMPDCSPRLMPSGRWIGTCRWTPRSSARTSTPPTCRASSGQPPAAQGAEWNYTSPATCLREEPADRALGRSRGGSSTKIHQLVDGRGRPVVVAVTAGQAGDSPMLKVLLAHLAVSRTGPGRSRTRPDALPGDKAYSSAANRARLRIKRVKTVIPQPSDQVAHRKRRGSAGWTTTRVRCRDLQGPQRGRAVLQRSR